MNSKIVLIIIVIILSVGGLFIFNFTGTPQSQTEIPDSSQFPTSDSFQELSEFPAISIFVRNIEVPWSMDFLPNGQMIFTERPGRVNLVDDNGSIQEIADINVYSVSESGLHGVAVDPDFNNNNYIYLYYTYQSEGNNTLNRVSRYILSDDSLDNETVIVDEIPGAPNHDGGRIKFGPDNHLYITTGDAQTPSSAQDRNSLAGKILRVDRDGNAASGNPFNTLVYSYGHRNPQGITWDEDDKLWSTEHGRSGAQSGLDELNLIESGRNYGWPEIEGDESATNMETPIVHSGARNTWAPGGAQYVNGSIFFAGLRGEALYEYNLASKTITEHLKNQLGRIRDVVIGPEGLLYIATSNRDGRGRPASDDDKIIMINPQKLSEL